MKLFEKDPFVSRCSQMKIPDRSNKIFQSSNANIMPDSSLPGKGQIFSDAGFFYKY